MGHAPDGDVWAILESLLLQRGMHTSKGTKVKGRAKDADVRNGAVRAQDKRGNDTADMQVHRGMLTDGERRRALSALHDRRRESYAQLVGVIQKLMPAILEATRKKRDGMTGDIFGGTRSRHKLVHVIAPTLGDQSAARQIRHNAHAFPSLGTGRNLLLDGTALSPSRRRPLPTALGPLLAFAPASCRQFSSTPSPVVAALLRAAVTRHSVRTTTGDDGRRRTTTGDDGRRRTTRTTTDEDGRRRTTTGVRSHFGSRTIRRTSQARRRGSAMSAPASFLISVLEAIQRADIQANERRRLGARAVEAALRLLAAAAGGTACEPSAVEPRLHFEDALVAVQAAAKTDEKLNVAKAKAWLRAQGSEGTSLASRLGRLSKARNAASHPDVSLIREIHRLQTPVDATDCKSSTIGSAVGELAGAGTTGSCDETGGPCHGLVAKGRPHDKAGIHHHGKHPTASNGGGGAGRHATRPGKMGPRKQRVHTSDEEGPPSSCDTSPPISNELHTESRDTVAKLNLGNTAEPGQRRAAVANVDLKDQFSTLTHVDTRQTDARDDRFAEHFWGARQSPASEGLRRQTAISKISMVQDDIWIHVQHTTRATPTATWPSTGSTSRGQRLSWWNADGPSTRTTSRTAGKLARQSFLIACRRSATPPRRARRPWPQRQAPCPDGL